MAAIFLGATILLDVSPLSRNLFLVGSLACAFAALAMIKGSEGPQPSGLPMIGFGVVMLAMGPPFSYWIYGDAFALVLRLEYPVRTARLLVHSGYALILVGLLLLVYSALRKSAPRQRTAPTNPSIADEALLPRSPLRRSMQKSMHMISFQLKAGLLVALALLAIISMMTYLGIF